MAKEDKSKVKDQKASGAKGESKTEGAKPKGQGKEATKAVAKPRVRVIPRLLERYRKEIVPTMMREFQYQNLMRVPHLKKVVINVGVGEALTNAKALDGAVKDITSISGQKPIVRRAKTSIATFKLREGNPIGVKVTLRGDRMYSFLDRLVNIALPRVRDFRGLNPKSFDGRGNYSLGIKEHTIFPEIDYDKAQDMWGMDITVCTTAANDDEARALLTAFNFPFRQ